MTCSRVDSCPACMYGARLATLRSDGVLYARSSSSPSVTAKRSSSQSSARIAIAARAAELAGHGLACSDGTPTVDTGDERGSRYTGVVEVIVRELRPVVTGGAVRLADEETQPGLLVLRERVLRRARPRVQFCLDVAVEARRGVFDAALVG